MSVSTAVQNCIIRQGIHYDVISHTATGDSMHTANAAHIPGDQLAKSVMLEDDGGFLMAVVPATHRVEFGTLRWQLDRRLGLTTEENLDRLFPDCQPGAIPPLGPIYGLETVLDESLAECEDIYFEAGDHRHVVHVSGQDFLKLLEGSGRGRFSRHV
ncbi:MAG: YbaK/EbsC family protein [Gammaproteobacteria bacterium]|nr:YbaK/EbsC family protein [Gammaproteobacteria bacterium]